MTRTRIAATAVLGVGLVLLGAGGAQAADITAVDDTATWTRTDVASCFHLDVLANDSGHGQDISLMGGTATVVSGAATVDTTSDAKGSQYLKVCPATGLKPGDVIVLTYSIWAPSQPSATPASATATITVAGTIGAPASTPTAALSTPLSIPATVRSTVVVSSLSNAAVTGATKFVAVDGPLQVGASLSSVSGGDITLFPTADATGTYTVTYATDAGDTGHLQVTVLGGASGGPTGPATTYDPANASDTATYETGPTSTGGASVLDILSGLALALIGAGAPVVASLARRFFA
jgi:hypothetical protein